MSNVKVEVAKAPDQAELQAWCEKHGVTLQNGGYIDLPQGQAALNDEGIIENVRANATRDDIPNLRGSVYQPSTMVFIAGGPTLAQHIDEIKAKCENPAYDVYTSNRTCLWMLAHGMKPKYHVIIDPQDKKVEDIQYDDDIELVLGLQCSPKLFDEAVSKGKRIKKFLAASTTKRENGETDGAVARAAVTPRNPELIAIGGGSMAGTRMIYLAFALGYRRIEYYGFDACSIFLPNGVVQNYAYPKARTEAVLEVEAANGRTFFSTPALARQADEIVQLMDKLPGVEVVVHGDSFMSNQVAMYKELNAPKPYRISPEYKALQEKFHDDTPHYGTSGAEHASRVFLGAAQILKSNGRCRVLDYGCGKETLRKAIEESFPHVPGISISGYDPGRRGLDAEPEKAEMVVCTDVMEHIEPDCVDAVVRHIHDLTECVAIIDVALQPAQKVLPDGRNAHICLRPVDWWLSYLRKYFVLIEQASNEHSLLVVGQPIWKWRERMEAKKAA